MKFDHTNIKAISLKALLRTAISLAAYLLDEFGDSIDFYQIVQTQTVERWMRESFPEVVERLEREQVYDAFHSRLDEYCENLQSAAIKAEYVLEHGAQGGLEDETDHLIFSGLIARISTGTTAQFDEKSLLTAFLLDKHRRGSAGRWHDYSVQSVAPHSNMRLRGRAWDFCDLPRAASTNADIAYLLPREHFPGNVAIHTREEYALVVNVPAGITPSALVTPANMDSVNISVDTERNERSLTLGSCPFLIPLDANAATLELFRNHLPVLYLGDDMNLLVEYPWNPVTDLTNYMHPHIRYEMPPEMDDESVGYEAFLQTHPHVIRIGEIRPMPLLEGPVLPQRESERLHREKWDEEPIPF
ncbi:hypothetical protein [Paraburkholderia sp. C35]|uniref:hypothetical protein n=1 Tax=Paraburkholderia sp. C35 TaxID=2126993 RepID=UPI000D69AF8A|nr:hypothetical protein [Paraburkholderia sp. C35]